jgi:hypothetical protein
LKVWAVSAIAFLQVFLFSAHWFVYFSLVSFWPPRLPLDAAMAWDVRAVLFVLSISFVAAAMLGFRFANGMVGFIYKVAAIWLGTFNYLFWASCGCWLAALVVRAARPDAAMGARPWIGLCCFAAALATAVYGLINARLIRARRLTVSLPNLPAPWKGRTALLVTDIHLGNINAANFSRRIAALAQRLDPAVIFLAGDLYDGAKVDPERVAAPLFAMKPRFGVFFCGGNHEDFGDPAHYMATLTRGGMRVLHNERVVIDGLQVVGVSYADSTYPAHLRAFLEGLHLNEGPASVLLNHVPHRLPVVEQSGVSLQLSGHTHGGQLFPFTLFTRWVYGKFTYGLQRFGRLQVLTSSGVGTWGPPMRVGTAPEVVLITLE